MILQYIVSGITNGSLYALLAIGFVLIYKSTTIVNFAQGELLMVGAYFGIFFHSMGLPFYVVFPLAFVSSFLVGIIINNTICRPLLHAHHLNVVIATFALSFFLRSIIRLIWGSQYFSSKSPFSDVTYNFSNISISANNLWITVLAVSMMLVLYLVFKFTKIGKSLIATSQNLEAAALMGVNVNASFSIIWGVSAGLSAVSGILSSPITGVSPFMGAIGLKAFAAAVLGGFTSLPGAALGGILLGIIENFSTLYLSSEYKDVIAFVILILVLIIRPDGLLGKKQVERV